MAVDKISPKVIERLTKYLRCLENSDGEDYISSKDLADKMGFTAAQVRKDLANFGEFGIRGKGYKVNTLYNDIEKILGINKINNVIIVGFGRLGSALYSESEFTKQRFNVVGIFDNSELKIGKSLKNIEIKNISELSNEISKYSESVDIAILTVPKIVAQEVSELIADSGIKAILNFAPIKLNLPESVVVENIDLYAKLQEINYWKEKILKKAKKKSKKIKND